jgi:hypothetical protein
MKSHPIIKSEELLIRIVQNDQGCNYPGNPSAKRQQKNNKNRPAALADNGQWGE